MREIEKCGSRSVAVPPLVAVESRIVQESRNRWVTVGDGRRTVRGDHCAAASCHYGCGSLRGKRAKWEFPPPRIRPRGLGLNLDMAGVDE
jgi:hypothetical protein